MTTPKTLMTDKDVDKLRATGYEAEHELIDGRGVRILGVAAQVAADAIVALREQSAELLADATAWRSFGDAAGVLKREAESLSKSVNVDEYAAALAESREKAQRWDAAHAHDALDRDAIGRMAFSSDERFSSAWNEIVESSREMYRKRGAAIVAHVRAHDAAGVESLRDRLATIIDEEFGMQPVMSVDELLTTLERELLKSRRSAQAALRASPPAPTNGGVRVGDEVAWNGAEWQVTHSIPGLVRLESLGTDRARANVMTREIRVINRATPNPGEVWRHSVYLHVGTVVMRPSEGQTDLRYVKLPTGTLIFMAPPFDGWEYVGPAEATSAPAEPDAIAEWLDLWSTSDRDGIGHGCTPDDANAIYTRVLARCVTALVGEVRRNERMRHECMTRQSERLSKLEAGNE